VRVEIDRNRVKGAILSFPQTHLRAGQKINSANCCWSFYSAGMRGQVSDSFISVHAEFPRIITGSGIWTRLRLPNGYPISKQF